MSKRSRPIRVAAAADVHASPERRAEVEEAFAGLGGRADVLLLAGDLTTLGEPEQAAVVAEACRPLGIPVCAVLGNHDWHGDRRDELVAALEEGGVVVLDRSWTVLDLDGTELGVVGTKGFVGGFPDSALPDFGEPLLRQVYAETTAEVSALAEGLRAVAHCPLRVVLLHYAPTSTTLEGEPKGIYAFLGSDRLAHPIAEHTPDLVLHGHGHAGTFEGFIGAVPVFNVSVPVMGRDFWVFELPSDERSPDGPL
ncbi:MAG TPA: metallophosphoesterase [Gaiellaceae bacterium]|nr:metallophosphoesterase [Gaiellaceae bacterium]